jgi:prepilin signal peptidase PulO-like enzyme (type II secretory pathway)
MLRVFLSVFILTWLGASTASYLGVVADRGWRGSLVGRSVCVCGRQLTWSENIPVLSYLFLKGRAKCCSAKIPSRYVRTEVGLALASGTTAVLLGTKAGVVALVLGSYLTLKASTADAARQASQQSG